LRIRALPTEGCGIFATIAEFERELIRDRVRSGLASARAKGKCLGRPRVYAGIVTQNPPMGVIGTFRQQSEATTQIELVQATE
jgi:DNA invertase Pin-like site-specific DNA recombinase